MKCQNVYESILERALMFHPYYANKISYWSPSGHYEILLVLEDGSKMLYDDFTEEIYPVICEDDNYDDEYYNLEFAKRLKRRMIICCISQEQLSEKTGISTVTISKYMNGKSLPNIRIASKLARVLKCSTNELINF